MALSIEERADRLLELVDSNLPSTLAILAGILEETRKSGREYGGSHYSAHYAAEALEKELSHWH